MKQTTRFELTAIEVRDILAKELGLSNAELTEGDSYEDNWIIEGDKK